MTDYTLAPQTLIDVPDDDFVEMLATQIMGWHKEEEVDGPDVYEWWVSIDSDGMKEGIVRTSRWNPLYSLEDAMEVWDSTNKTKLKTLVRNRPWIRITSDQRGTVGEWHEWKVEVGYSLTAVPAIHCRGNLCRSICEACWKLCHFSPDYHD